MLIIGFGHLSRVGKDTAAMYLQHHLSSMGVKVQCDSFALSLKDICHRLYHMHGVKPAIWYENHPEDRKKILPYFGKTVVEVWIEVGNKLREVDINTWVHPAINPLTTATCEVKIMRDTRFPNEVDAIREKGGIVGEVVKPGENGLGSTSDEALRGFQFDFRINNNGTLDQLSRKMAFVAMQSGTRTAAEFIAAFQEADS